MVNIADIFRIHGPEYREKFGARMLPSHLKAMEAIEQCRTEALGGQVYLCESCQEPHYSYHSCKNRHCPTCQNGQGQKWLEEQKEMLLPVSYFMVTPDQARGRLFTVPEELRDLIRSHQRDLYNILFRASAAALQELAYDPRFVGGKLGMHGVLQTWTRDMFYHPHVHYLVPGGGLSPDGSTWLPSREDFFVHVKPLSILFRAKFRDELKKTDLFLLVDPQVWSKSWVVDCEPVGSGEEAFRYLAPYIFRVAITNNRILGLEDGKVTPDQARGRLFEYKDSSTAQMKQCTITAEDLIRRFLQHVLPDRFIKVRSYGFLAPSNRHLLEKIKELLGGVSTPETESAGKASDLKEPKDVLRCPLCGGILILVETIQPKSRLPT